jgi:hypothetical protein
VEDLNVNTGKSQASGEQLFIKIETAAMAVEKRPATYAQLVSSLPSQVELELNSNSPLRLAGAIVLIRSESNHPHGEPRAQL